MRTALDSDPETLPPEDREFVEAIREHGWFNTRVLAEEGSPGFSYTTGFWLNRGLPEIILFSLPKETTHGIFWDLFRDLEKGAPPPTGIPVPGVFGNADAYFFPVAPEHSAEHLRWSGWFYGSDDFPCLQLVWPDRAGLFPWQEGFEERFRADQPDLSEEGWAKLARR